jgi:hypothetical protein
MLAVTKGKLRRTAQSRALRKRVPAQMYTILISEDMLVVLCLLFCIIGNYILFITGRKYNVIYLLRLLYHFL